VTLEKCGANLKSIADAHGIISQSLDRKVLTELSVNEIAPLQLVLPVPIGFDLINEDRLDRLPRDSSGWRDSG
jgi:hypothetical protein